MKIRPLHKGELISLRKFAEMVENKELTDLSGYGHFATEAQYDDKINIFPSQFSHLIFPSWATYILWFKV